MRIIVGLLGCLVALVIAGGSTIIIAVAVDSSAWVTLLGGGALFYVAGIIGHLSLDALGADEPYWRQ